MSHLGTASPSYSASFIPLGEYGRPLRQCPRAFPLSRLPLELDTPMAAFTTTSPASRHIITALVVLVVLDLAALAGSYLLAARDRPDLSVSAPHSGADVATNIRPAASS